MNKWTSSIVSHLSLIFYCNLLMHSTGTPIDNKELNSAEGKRKVQSMPDASATQPTQLLNNWDKPEVIPSKETYDNIYKSIWDNLQQWDKAHVEDKDSYSLALVLVLLTAAFTGLSCLICFLKTIQVCTEPDSFLNRGHAPNNTLARDYSYTQNVDDNPPSYETSVRIGKQELNVDPPTYYDAIVNSKREGGAVDV